MLWGQLVVLWSSGMIKNVRIGWNGNRSKGWVTIISWASFSPSPLHYELSFACQLDYFYICSLPHLAYLHFYSKRGLLVYLCIWAMHFGYGPCDPNILDIHPSWSLVILLSHFHIIWILLTWSTFCISNFTFWRFWFLWMCP